MLRSDLVHASATRKFEIRGCGAFPFSFLLETLEAVLLYTQTQFLLLPPLSLAAFKPRGCEMEASKRKLEPKADDQEGDETAGRKRSKVSTFMAPLADPSSKPPSTTPSNSSSSPPLSSLSSSSSSPSSPFSPSSFSSVVELIAHSVSSKGKKHYQQVSQLTALARSTTPP